MIKILIDIARMICGSWQGLCDGTVSVRPSVCPSNLSPAACRCGGFATEGPAGRIYR